jgi:Tol biopolymer transport system component
MARATVGVVVVAAVLAASGASSVAVRSHVGSSCAHPVISEDLYAVNADGSGCRALLARPGAFHVLDLAPDGARIAAIGVDRRLLISNLAGTKTHELGLRWVWDATWSPDGRKLAVGTIPPCFETPCETKLWVVNLAGGTKKLGDAAAEPSWSPDSRRLVFIANFGRPGAAITVASADGSGRRELGPWQPPGAHSPPWGLPNSDLAWSPRGDWIAYDSGSPAAIHLIRPNGAHDYTLAAGVAPVWSPNGRRIAFLHFDRSASSSLWVIARDRSRKRRLEAANVVLPAWAPDGGTIAYAATRRSGSTQLYTVAADGGSGRQLLRRPPATLFTAVFWGPAGRRVYFAASVMTGE